jgi:hypothetical protein
MVSDDWLSLCGSNVDVTFNDHSRKEKAEDGGWFEKDDGWDPSQVKFYHLLWHLIK